MFFLQIELLELRLVVVPCEVFCRKTIQLLGPANKQMGTTQPCLVYAKHSLQCGFETAFVPSAAKSLIILSWKCAL